MDNLNTTFAALGDATRRAILTQLMQGESRLSDLAKPFEMSQTAVSKHVRILRDAGLVIIEKRGRIRHCRVNAEPLGHAVVWLNDYQTFWENQFDNLALHLANQEN